MRSRQLVVIGFVGLSPGLGPSSLPAQRDAPQVQAAGVTISLRHGTEREARAKTQLERVLDRFKIGPWLFTRDIVIDQNVIPTSHPALTLNAGSLANDTLLLGTFLHEQFHWLEEGRPAAKAQAIAAFRALFPEVPSGGDQGARDVYSTYLHLIVCDLEFHALTILVGESSARAILRTKPYYKWIYDRVLHDPAVRATNLRFGFVPPPLVAQPAPPAHEA